MNNTKVVLTSLILLISGILFAQTSDSPYSRYGIGDLSNQRFGQFQGLGNTSIGIRNSFYLNYSNPASYSAIDSLAFIWDVGVIGRYTEFSSSSANQVKSDMNLSHMAAGFRITNWMTASFGLLPLSNVGYSISTESLTTSPQGENQIIQTYHEGSGGINQVYIGSSFNLPHNFSVGINAKYLFGTVDHTRTVNILDEDGNSVSENFSTQESQQMIVSDFTYDIGLQYTNTLKNNWGYTLGLVFANESKIKAKNNIFTEAVNGYGLLDTITDIEGAKDHFVLPRNLGVGFSIYNEKLLFAADYTTQDWSNATFLGKKDSLANLSRFSAGLEYLPNYRSLKYLARVRYRIGAKYESTYLDLKGEQLKDYSITVGFGLPLRKRKSTININFELGRRGTTDNNLIEENYGLISLNLSLHDIWFVRRKFD